MNAIARCPRGSVREDAEHVLGLRELVPLCRVVQDCAAARVGERLEPELVVLAVLEWPLAILKLLRVAPVAGAWSFGAPTTAPLASSTVTR